MDGREGQDERQGQRYDQRQDLHQDLHQDVDRQPRAGGLTERGDDATHLDRRGATATGDVASGHRVLPAPVVRFITVGWPAMWILMFIFGGPWQVALAMMFLTGPVMAALHGRRAGDDRRRRRIERHERHRQRTLAHVDAWRQGFDVPAAPAPRPVQAPPFSHIPPAQTPQQAPQPQTPHPVATTSQAERALAATLVRAESSASRLDADALELVREVEHLLRPLLAHARSRDVDALLRRDLDAVATEHLPTALDAYLVLPTDYAHEHRTSTGTTPADELRSQLTLLVEGCRQLRDAVHDADVDRQQQLSRFLDAKFRRSDLDL